MRLKPGTETYLRQGTETEAGLRNEAVTLDLRRGT